MRAMPVTELKAIVIEYLRSEGFIEEWTRGESVDELEKKLVSAVSVEDVFTTLHLHTKDDGWDVLV